jgi:hypothetical protein
MRAILLACRQAHERCQAVARRAAAVDRESDRALLDAERARVCVYLAVRWHRRIRRMPLRIAPKMTLERLRVAGVLESLPRLDEALDAGELSYSAVRELTRVAVAGTEVESLSAAAGKTVRQIEELVSGRVAGDRRGPGARRHVLRFEVAADILALFREAVGALRQAHGGDLDHEQIELVHQPDSHPRRRSTEIFEYVAVFYNASACTRHLARKAEAGPPTATRRCRCRATDASGR